MKKLLKLFMLITFLSCAAHAFCEQDWQCYTNCNIIYSIAVQGDDIWCGTTGGVVCWNKSDNTYRKFTISEGLSANFSTNIAVGADGIIWVRSGSSISTFDGASWKSHVEDELPWKINVDTIAVDTDGIMWAGVLTGGVVRINGSEWKKYTTEDGLVNNEVYACAVDKSGVKWFGTKKGISSFEGTTWTNYTSEDGLVDNRISSIAVDNTNGKWFGTTKGVSCFDGTEWKTYSSEYGVFSIAVDNENVKWFGTNNGLVRYDDVSWEYIYKEISGLPDNYINDMVIDDDGALWLSTGTILYRFAGHGLTSFDGTVWNTYRTDGPVYNILRGVAVDNNNVKWFGTDIGISSFDGTTWETKRTIDGTGISAIARIWLKPDNTMWFGRDISLDGEKWTLHNQDDTSWQHLQMSCYEVDKNDIEWIITFANELYSYDGSEWTHHTSEKDIPDEFRSLAIDNNNIKWLGTKYGVVRYDGTVWTLYNEEKGFVSDHVNAIAVDSENTKWFGTWKNGLWSFDGTTWESYLPTNIELDHNLIQKLFIFDDVLWIIGNFGKLLSFDGVSWQSYDGVDNFFAGQVTNMAMDNNNVIWLTTYDTGVISFKNPYADNPLATAVTANGNPEKTSITSHYPNPFNISTTISFILPKSGVASLIIYNITGQKVRELLTESLPAGTHSVAWNGRDDNGTPVSSGMYFSRLLSGKHIAVGRMLLLK
ncbi:two-component regulator propeller domain-containing protein [Candidatus Omnitrophota bacterium]